MLRTHWKTWKVMPTEQALILTLNAYHTWVWATLQGTDRGATSLGRLWFFFCCASLTFHFSCSLPTQQWVESMSGCYCHCCCYSTSYSQCVWICYFDHLCFYYCMSTWDRGGKFPSCLNNDSWRFYYR